MVGPIVIRACRERQEFVDYLLRKLRGQEVIVVWDKTKNAMDTFLEALRVAVDRPALHMEEDSILTVQFAEKVSAVVERFRGQVPIQFFSRRTEDESTGARWESGASFIYGQCFYLPQGMSRSLLEYAPSWKRIGEHPTGLDLMVADFLKENKIRYWIEVPSLVQHRVTVSMISPRRSKYRQSPTFRDPDVD